MTPEVRDVYARMLATDKEIEVKREADSPSLFGEELGQTVTQVVDNTNLPDETKAVIKEGLETLGIKTEQAPDQSKLSGVMTDDQFVQSRFDLDMETATRPRRARWWPETWQRLSSWRRTQAECPAPRYVCLPITPSIKDSRIWQKA